MKLEKVIIKKSCSVCKDIFELDYFAKNKASKDGCGSKCKTCVKEYNKKYRSDPSNKSKAVKYKKNRYNKERHPLGYTAVYYLPEEHYVGITLNVKARMNKHKNEGRISDGYEILGWFERSVDAHLFETLLHVRGYRGYFNGTSNPYDQ
jgi:hypothetical protein